MLTRSLLCVVAGLVLAGCSRYYETSADHPVRNPVVPAFAAPDSTQVASATLGPVTRLAECHRVFSTPAAPDVFRLALHGDSLLTAPAVLTIRTAAGRLLFRHVFAAGALEGPLRHELSGVATTVLRRETYVRQRLKTFFSDEHFRSPAVQPGDEFRPTLVSRPVWEALQVPGTLGYSFLAGPEDGHRVAWVPQQRKVVRYAGFGG